MFDKTFSLLNSAYIKRRTKYCLPYRAELFGRKKFYLFKMNLETVRFFIRRSLFRFCFWLRDDKLGNFSGRSLRKNSQLCLFVVVARIFLCVSIHFYSFGTVNSTENMYKYKISQFVNMPSIFPLSLPRYLSIGIYGIDLYSTQRYFYSRLK